MVVRPSDMALRQSNIGVLYSIASRDAFAMVSFGHAINRVRQQKRYVLRSLGNFGAVGACRFRQLRILSVVTWSPCVCLFRCKKSSRNALPRQAVLVYRPVGLDNHNQGEGEMP